MVATTAASFAVFVLFFSYNNYQLHKRLMPQYKYEKPQYRIVLEWNSSVLRVKVSNVKRSYWLTDVLVTGG